MGKGSRRRVSQITRAEEELRWKLFQGYIGINEFNKRYNKLKKDNLVIRSGKVVR